jgi:AcrR family transcriptional regulator
MSDASPRAKLLAAAIDHIARHGGADRSLRALAADLGTSHRMLIYHFGSKEGLLTAVAREVEARQRATLADLGDGLGFWRRLTGDDLRANEKLFFQLYGQALGGTPGTTELLDGVVTDWLGPLEALLARYGVPEADRPAHARLGLAVARGLLLDLVTTGDRAAVDAAMARFLAITEAGLTKPEHQADAARTPARQSRSRTPQPETRRHDARNHLDAAGPGGLRERGLPAGGGTAGLGPDHVAVTGGADHAQPRGVAAGLR